jgi:predicted MFS family arabinose efflux permease
MAVVWTLATVACGLAGSFVLLFVARLFIGAGEGGYNAGAVSMVSGVFPERLRTTAVSLFISAGTLGSVIGVAVGGYVVTHWGWREAFFVVAAPGFAVVLLFMLTAKDFRTVALEVRDGSGGQRKPTSLELLRSLFATPSLLCLYIGISGVLFINAAIFAWAPTLFSRSEHLPMDQASMRSALVLLAAAAGAILGGMAVDRLKRRIPRISMIGPAAYALISGLAFAIALAQLEGNTRFIVMMVAAFFMSATFGPMFAACQSVVHAGLRATTVGVINVIGQIIGSLGPIVTGMLSDSMGLGISLAIAASALLASALALFVGSHFYDADVAKVPVVLITAAD